VGAIFGIVRFDGAAVLPREIERMGQVLAHHGPDGRRTEHLDGVGLGHCLLRVNTEDAFEAQPLVDGDVMLAADLRLDNREALAALLCIGDEDLREMPDSAVLLAAYRRWGETCAEHLLGDFTFAIWDAARRELLLARDHMGQRGLFYHHGDGFLAFATDVKALWAVEDVPRRLSENAIGRRLVLAIDPVPGTWLFEDIAVLPNATVVRLDRAGALTTTCYWEPGAGAEHLGRDEAYYLAAYRQVVTEAVACRVRRLTRAPALCFSGGFDSGSIAAIAGPIVAERGRKIIAAASVLEEGESRPARRSARAAVEAFRPYPFMDIRYYVRGDDSMFDDLETTFELLHSTGGTPYVRNGLYRIAAAAGARLVMDGHGGDYTVNVCAGAMLGRMLRRGQLRGFAREFRARMRATGAPARRVLRNDVLPALMPLRLMRWADAAARGFAPQWRERAIPETFARSLFTRGVADAKRLRGGAPLHNRWRDRWLHMLRKIAQAPPQQPAIAAAHGLAFTRPFHDKRIVELGLAIPEALQFRNGLERYLARTVFRDKLPAQLRARASGNDAEEPDMFRMARAGAPTALAAALAQDRGGRLSRHIDFEKLQAMIADPDETKRPDHHRLAIANVTITLARFIAWFDRSNA
jgi:asparagine synthase (glutamine-hydrolysing)